MRKTLAAVSAIIIVGLLVTAPVMAEEVLPILDRADIQVSAEDEVYQVEQMIFISNGEALNEKGISHTLSKIVDNGVVEGVTFQSNGELLNADITEGQYLDRYTVRELEPSDGVVEYTISYTVPKSEGNFDVPLFVPEIATANEGRDVHVSFKAPEGTEIQKNSFPTLIESGQNEADKSMMNIPSMLNYVYSDEPTTIHSYNIVSGIALIALLALLIGWGFIEARKKEEVL